MFSAINQRRLNNFVFIRKNTQSKQEEPTEHGTKWASGQQPFLIGAVYVLDYLSASQKDTMNPITQVLPDEMLHLPVSPLSPLTKLDVTIRSS